MAIALVMHMRRAMLRAGKQRFNADIDATALDSKYICDICASNTFSLDCFNGEGNRQAKSLLHLKRCG